jgi:hypothetical protein
MHHTNEAFERYFQIELEDSRKVYRETRGKIAGHKVVPFYVEEG